MDLKLPVASLRGVGNYLVSKLETLGIKTLKDLLFYFPFRYEDFSNVKKIKDLKEGEVATILTRIERISLWRTPRRRMYIVDCKAKDETGDIKITWFNQPFLAKNIKKDYIVAFAGKIDKEGKRFVLKNPGYEVISSKAEDDEEIKISKEDLRHVGRIVPIYYQTRGLTSKILRTLISRLFALVPPKVLTEFIPEEIIKRNKFPKLSPALSQIHFPEKIENAKAAWRRFAFESLFLFQVKVIQEKAALAREKAPAILFEPNVVKNFIKNGLGFELTPSQKISSFEVLKDLEKPRPMNRLLQGDVGSGKTAVAEIAALSCARSGYQTVFMAPTEILAQQHFSRLLKDFSAENITLALITGSSGAIAYAGSRAEKSKEEIREVIKLGRAEIIIGTHALISQDREGSGVKFSKVGLAIIDEQHRFGVEQRGVLVKNSINLKEKLMPHFLSMSATPIPRSLALILYGDLDISVLKEKPPGRQEIETKVVNYQKRNEVYDFIKKEIKDNRQAFLICPRVEEPDETEEENYFSSGNAIISSDGFFFETRAEIKAVKKEYKKLKEEIFKDYRVGILYGKMKSGEKEKTMKLMAEGKIDILVSSSVVEVGVDVPNASVMAVEGAEHFGLAQLHQFRGRVGRSSFKSYCFLITETAGLKGIERLKALEQSNDGFFLAKKDLFLRGPGQFFGKRQAGLPDIAMESLKSLELLKEARTAALEIIKESPDLKVYPLLMAKLKETKESVLLG